jgi:hypothetical protein
MSLALCARGQVEGVVAEVVTYMSVVMPYAVGGSHYPVQTKAGLELKCELVRL